MTTATIENSGYTSGITGATLGGRGTVHVGDRFLDNDPRTNGDSVQVLTVGLTRATVERNHSGRHVSIKVDRLLNKSRFTRVE